MNQKRSVSVCKEDINRSNTKTNWRTVLLDLKKIDALKQSLLKVDCVSNAMAHVQKPDFVFRRNGQVHLNRQGRQFSRLLAAEECTSAVVMQDTPCSEVLWRVLATTPFTSFPFTSPTVHHRVPSHFNWTLLLR